MIAALEITAQDPVLSVPGQIQAQALAWEVLDAPTTLKDPSVAVPIQVKDLRDIGPLTGQLLRSSFLRLIILLPLPIGHQFTDHQFSDHRFTDHLCIDPRFSIPRFTDHLSTVPEILDALETPEMWAITDQDLDVQFLPDRPPIGDSSVIMTDSITARVGTEETLVITVTGILLPDPSSVIWFVGPAPVITTGLFLTVIFIGTVG